MTVKNIYVCGHNGMVGSSLVRYLSHFEDVNLITADRSRLDLLDQSAVKAFMSDHKIDQVYLAAAKVGGIYANNKYPFDFLSQKPFPLNSTLFLLLTTLRAPLFSSVSCRYIITFR